MKKSCDQFHGIFYNFDSYVYFLFADQRKTAIAKWMAVKYHNDTVDSGGILSGDEVVELLDVS